jgi:predicted transcriptional regulator of viral defense system
LTVEWQARGYLQRIVNRWYRFTEVPADEALLRFTATRIYQPAYLSLETALSYHGLIPEGVYTLICVSPRKTQEY